MLEGTSITQEACRSTVEKLRKYMSFGQGLTPEVMTMRSAMEHKYSDVQFVLHALFFTQRVIIASRSQQASGQWLVQ